MASSSIQGGARHPARPSGTDVDALGPSDSSDTGSDVQHERRMPTRADSADELGALPAHRDSTSDAQGTGERASAVGDAEGRQGADIAPDQVVDLTEASADSDAIDDDDARGVAELADDSDDTDDEIADSDDEARR